VKSARFAIGHSGLQRIFSALARRVKRNRWAAMPRKEMFKALRKPLDTKDQLQDRTEGTINREMFIKKKPT